MEISSSIGLSHGSACHMVRLPQIVPFKQPRYGDWSMRSSSKLSKCKVKYTRDGQLSRRYTFLIEEFKEAVAQKNRTAKKYGQIG